MPYIVTNWTPGYLPDEDDPARFEDDELDAAREYLREEVARYVEHIEECDAFPTVSWDAEECWSARAHVTRSDRTYDLGRTFEILECEDDES